MPANNTYLTAKTYLTAICLLQAYQLVSEVNYVMSYRILKLLSDERITELTKLLTDIISLCNDVKDTPDDIYTEEVLEDEQKIQEL